MHTFFNHTQRSYSSGPHFLGLLLIGAGIFSAVSPLFFEGGSSIVKSGIVGAVSIVTGLIVRSFYEGTEIDFNENKIKTYTSIIGIKSSQWTSLPPISKVKLTSSTYHHTNTSNGVSPTLSGKVTDYTVTLFDSDSQAVQSFSYTKKKKASTAAIELSTGFKVGLENQVD